MTECPQCHELMGPRQVVCDCGWVKPSGKVLSLAKPDCNFCHHKNPTERMRHWIQEAANPDALQHHLKAEFGSYYHRNPNELGFKMREIQEQRSVVTCKLADDSGHWLEPHVAFSHYHARRNQQNSIIGMQDDFERSLKARVASQEPIRGPLARFLPGARQ